VVKEFVEEDASAVAIFRELKGLVNSGPARLSMVSSLLTCRKILGERGAHSKAADKVMEVLNNASARH
jgi:hypothetical protein